jgi:predicted nucleic acid-binding protein
MEALTTKIVDNTVISASIREINSIDLIEVCSSNYYISTTVEVFNETRKGFNKTLIDRIYASIELYELKNKDYEDLLNWFEVRYPYLHIGEVSSFLLAVLEYAIKSKKYYYITDDNKMKKTIKFLLKDERLIEKLGTRLNKFNITGTIGLIIRLKERGLVSRNEMENIIKDLNSSSFYITSELIEELRRYSK